jgi:plastocyanin
MTRQNISVGNAPNDGTGDPLRVAFQKINNNFSELYNNFGSSGLNFVGNVVSTSNTNDDINLVPNGSGQVKIGGNNPVRIYNTSASTSTTTGALTVAGGVGIGGNVEVGGSLYAPAAAFNNLEGTIIGAALPAEGYFTDVTITGDILPTTANVYNIGSALNPFGNLFVETIVSASSGFLSLDNTPIGNLVPSWGQFTTVVATNGVFQNITVANPWDEVLGNLIVNYTSVLGGNTSVGGQLLINRQDNMSTPIPGPAILPSTTGIYDIGTSAARFRDAYLSGNASITGNVTTSGKFIGDLIGGATTAITAGSTTYATTAGSATSAVRVTDNAQPYINSLGTLNSLTVDGPFAAQKTASFSNNTSFSGNVTTLSRVSLQNGFLTDSSTLGLIPGLYVIDLSEKHTSTISLTVAADLTISYDTANIAAGATVTLIILNSDAVQHDVFLPDTMNNKNDTGFAVQPGIHAFTTFYAVHNPAGAPDVYCQIVNA